MNEIIISLDETHHLMNGKPFYSHRFDKVQSFHFPPGYAPVKKDRRAFFVDTEGKPVFDRSFKDAFGFYDGVATVVDETGFFHIDEQGKDIHPRRFAWSGNFQEGICMVEDLNSGQFFHIDRKADPIYTESYAYIGDYRYGIAVAINDDGLCTHIDDKGRLLHGKYFLELDVYHKGYAIAKDERGYFHIDKEGKALYNQRYIKLEPYYNGRALVVDKYGVKRIISTKGEAVKRIDSRDAEIRKIEHDYSQQAFSYWDSRILTSILELGILDRLEKNISSAELYRQLKLERPIIDMILCWLAIHELLTIDNGVCSLTLAGKIILHRLKPIFSYWQSSVLVGTSLKLTDSLETNQSSFDKIHGFSFFEYVQKNTKMANDLEKVMSFYAIDYSDYFPYLRLSDETVCDIGGGNGALLSSLKQCYPGIKPIILDKFAYNNRHGIEFVKTDFFQKWSLRADIYLMSRILHDWNDEQVTRLLGNIADNMSSKTILYVFETIVSEEDIVDKGVGISFHLLNLLGGRERTLSEFEALFQKSGLTIKDIYSDTATVSLMKVVKK